MPGKSRHGKGKRSSRSKRRRERQRFPTVAAQPQVVTETPKPPSRPSVSAPSVSTPPPVIKPAIVQYPYIAIELRTIGILAGILLVILVVLALVLS